MRALLVIVIGVFLLVACGTATGSQPAQPSPLPDQPFPTQPPAATRDASLPAPTATMLSAGTAQPPSASVEPPAVVITVVSPPTVATTATPLPAIPPVKETPMPPSPMPPSDQGGTSPMPANAQPLTPPYDPNLARLIDQAKQDLAQRLGVDVSAVEVTQVAAVTWPDGSLGCPRPGMAYIQVLIDGLFVQLRVGDQLYNYHGDGRQPLFLCDAQFGPQSQRPLPPRNAP
ncbi:hypothetical protein [Chloroflexus sp.]|uniref:hypothetical protein n=1 Tax=Chloroflexus sp. TaxID=1904827 RepID=UPI002ADE1532|nr:hypothetical protein [Chloroflexus sp.]